MKMSAAHRTIQCPAFSQIIPRKNSKSRVWEYFGLPANENGKVVMDNIAICKICRKPVSSKSGCTSNLLAHLKLHHPLKYFAISNKGSGYSDTDVEVDDPIPNEPSTSSARKTNSNEINRRESSNRQKTIVDYQHQILDNTKEGASRQKTMVDYQPLDSHSSKRCTDAVAKFLSATMQPYSIVEQRSFVEMVKVLNNRYKLPGRKYFSNNAIPKLYSEVKDKIKHELSLIDDNAISITTDCWTSISNTPYIALTAHFISTDWILKSVCLACSHFEENHNSENIAAMVKNVLSEWDINTQNIVSCTTDNASNMLKAVEKLNLKNVHVSCFGHNINIGINHSLQLTELKNAVARLKKLQNTIAMSWKMKRDLFKAQELLQMSSKTLPSACPTRWGSTRKLMSRFLHNQLAIRKMLLDYPTKEHLMLEGAEISALQDFVTATELLDDITKSLSGEEYTTGSSVLPLYHKIKNDLQSKEDDSSLLAKIKLEILKSLKKYEAEPLKSLLSVSTFFDPRFRNFIDEETKRIVLDKMVTLYKERESKLSSNNPASDSEPPPKKIKKGLAKFFEDDETDHDNRSNPSQQAEKEMRSYLSLPKVDFEENPLSWWKMHQNSFLTLKTLANIYLTVQGSSVASERVFSTGGNVINKHRTSLLPKHAEMQVFLAQNKIFLI